MKQFAVIGLGQFGTSIARSLANKGAEVLAIDIKPERIESIKDEVAHAVCLDSTDIKSLKSQQVDEFDAVVVAIGEDFESLLLTSVLLLEMGVERVVARAANHHQRKILEKIGIKEILSPEDEVGRTVAEMLIQPDLKSFLRLPDNYEIVEVKTPRRVVNKTLGQIGLREKYFINLVTIRRMFAEEVKGEQVMVEHIVGVPNKDTVLSETDTLILMGTSSDVERFIEVNK